MRKSLAANLLLTIIILISFSTAYGQNKKTDVVFLKDGSIIRGSIIEYITNKHVKIETSDNTIWVFKHNEIDKINFNEAKTSNKSSALKSGYFNFTDMGVLIGSGINERQAPFSIMMVNGYRFNQQISTGIGTGIEFFSTPVIPVFIDTRYDFYQSSLSPFIFLKGGYSFQTGKDYYYYETNSTQGGAMFGAGIGIRVSLGENAQFVASLGYRYQKLKYSYYEEWSEDNINISEKYNRLAIRLGFVFK